MKVFCYVHIIKFSVHYDFSNITWSSQKEEWDLGDGITVGVF